MKKFIYLIFLSFSILSLNSVCTANEVEIICKDCPKESWICYNDNCDKVVKMEKTGKDQEKIANLKFNEQGNEIRPNLLVYDDEIDEIIKTNLINKTNHQPVVLHKKDCPYDYQSMSLIIKSEQLPTIESTECK